MISTALVLKGAYSGSTCITSHKRTPDEVPWLPLFLSWKEKQTNDVYECKFIIKRKKLLNIDWKWMSSCLCVLAFGWSDVKASFFTNDFYKVSINTNPAVCWLVLSRILQSLWIALTLFKLLKKSYKKKVNK